MNKAQIIEKSLQCLYMGLLGLIPVAGIGCAVVALLRFGEVRVAAGETWNPANRHLYGGFIAGGLGLCASCLCVFFLLEALSG